ncbi:hypothetical protein, partial [Streptomyces sp. WM4235]|uniref:hypothetical protein n=1 Tax=Streptomyces sp. WM4235 TaxID=1415551 RepID=UPI003B636FC7
MPPLHTSVPQALTGPGTPHLTAAAGDPREAGTRLNHQPPRRDRLPPALHPSRRSPTFPAPPADATRQRSGVA